MISLCFENLAVCLSLRFIKTRFGGHSLNIYICLFLCKEEQIIYPSSLENEKFVVALVNCGTEGRLVEHKHEMIEWEITRAVKV